MSGASDFAALSRRLREAGETGLRRELAKALRTAADPIVREIRDSSNLRSYMPDRYAETLAADLSVSTVQRGSIRSPGVRIQARTGTKKRKVGDVDAGVLHHPLYGNREHWFLQLRGMKAGFFTDPCEKSGPAVRDEILAAMDDVASKITGGH
jgi:hypothetical protein